MSRTMTEANSNPANTCSWTLSLYPLSSAVFKKKQEHSSWIEMALRVKCAGLLPGNHTPMIMEEKPDFISDI